MPAEFNAAVTFYEPRSSTCIVWALVNKYRFGGKVAIIQNPHFWWLYRALWSPDGEQWFGYIPLRPRRTPFRATCHSLWFRGRVRSERQPQSVWVKF